MSEVKIKFRADGSQVEATMTRLNRGVGSLSHELNSTLKNAVVAAFSVEAIKETISSTIEWADGVKKASDRLGLTVTNVQALKYAAKESGVEFEKLEGSLSKMEIAAANALGGKKKQSDAFKALGITDDQLKHLNKQDLLSQVGKGLQGMTQSQAIPNLAAIFGGGNAGGIFAMRNKLANFDQFKKDKEDSGAIAKPEDIEALAELKMKWEEVADSVKARLVPVLAFLLDKIYGFGRGVSQLVELIGTALGAFMGSIEKFDIVAGLKEFANQFINGIESLLKNAWAVIRGKKSIGEALGDVAETRANGDAEIIKKTFGKDVISNTAQIVQDKLAEQAQDDKKHAADEAAKKKAFLDSQNQMDKDPNRVAAPGSKAFKSPLDKDLKGGNDSFLKIGNFFGMKDASYRLERLAQKQTDYLAQIVKNTSPDEGIDTDQSDFNA